ncbi:MAG: hypothetical protein JNL13_10200 [Chitinophagaceae bacterium]|nr:hypothetical protein [Chitinophagaceae bacterium]
MNRLIILGNGFDLSHGLKTTYSDFIKYFWSNVTSSNFDGGLVKLWSKEEIALQACNSLSDLVAQINNLLQLNRPTVSADSIVWMDYVTPVFKIEFSNVLFKYLVNAEEDIMWCDIEMIYYKLLRSICPKNVDNVTKEQEIKSIQAVNKLNSDIRQFSSLFSNYLKHKIEPSLLDDNMLLPDYDDIFSNPSLSNFEEQKAFMEEFSHEFFQMLKEGKTSKVPIDSSSKIGRYNDTLILNFNYTTTANLYNHFAGRFYSEIKIHGSVSDSRNTVLLGFGDEKDKFYEVLENFNRNEYLEFMKSSHYAKNENYKRLFDFIESRPFQTQIIGHSCGLSDRTLLNSIFQHKNCMSIKTFYYQYKEGDEYNEEDNFSQIFRNISRHFSDKSRMRERIVNKDFCTPLPQSKLSWH